MSDEHSPFVHPSSVVDEGATLGAGTKVWHFSHVCAGAQIGAHVVLGQNTYVAPTARVGDGCRIQNNVSLYDGVELAHDVFVGPSVVFTNVRTPRAHVSRREDFESTIVERGASLGANVTIVCGVTLGEYCMIGAGSVITRSIDSFALVVGHPTRQLGWVCQCGKRLGRPTPHVSCSECNAEYMLMDDELFWINEEELL